MPFFSAACPRVMHCSKSAIPGEPVEYRNPRETREDLQITTIAEGQAVPTGFRRIRCGTCRLASPAETVGNHRGHED